MDLTTKRIIFGVVLVTIFLSVGFVVFLRFRQDPEPSLRIGEKIILDFGFQRVIGEDFDAKSEIVLLNKGTSPIEIVNVEFPGDVKGSYDVVDNARWKQDVMVKMRIPIIRKSVGKFSIVITVRYNNKQIYKINSSCIYIGATNVKPAQKS